MPVGSLPLVSGKVSTLASNVPCLGALEFLLGKGGATTKRSLELFKCFMAHESAWKLRYCCDAFDLASFSWIEVFWEVLTGVQVIRFPPSV